MKEALKKYFGFDSFRPPQDEIISSVLSGRDTLAIMPTGGGKSLCYQLPAMMFDGVTLVVSPLIALMKDQVDALRARGIAAAMINSSQSRDEQFAALDELRSGTLKLAYIAPERFRAPSFVRALSEVKISLFAVDEAHCISQWGHDFRPDYMRLGESLRAVGSPLCAAFTATATPEVRKDIVEQLGMRNPAVFVSGFARANLSFNVRQVRSKAEKDARVRALVDEYKKGIVYCATRKSVEALSQKLWNDGIRHVVYHGGMTPAERDAAQEAFVGGRENLAVATNAFGMGIDRADIRFVCHYELTGSVEAFYQEAGRAGRDGAPAYCEMLLMYSDRRVQEFFIDGANPDSETVRAVYRVVRENADNSYECFMPVEAIAEEVAAIKKFESASGARRVSYRMGGAGNYGGAKFGGGRGKGGANAMAVSSALSILRRLGYVERFDAAGARARGTRLPKPDISERELEISDGLLLEKRGRDERKLKDLIAFAYSKVCRQKWILDYFGEKNPISCGVCDNCRGGNAASESSTVDAFACELTEEEATEVRKALSGVARLSRRVGAREWRPRFGRERIVKSLCGSADAKITDFGLDRISTHGILKRHGRKFVCALLDSLSNAGLLETVSEGEYPLFGITPKGVEVLFDKSLKPAIAYPRGLSKMDSCPTPKKTSAPKIFSSGDVSPKTLSEATSKSAHSRGAAPRLSGRVGEPVVSRAGLDEADGRLYDIMAKERMRLAMIRKIKPFQIFTNATLLEFARVRPRSCEEASEIKGVGEKKLKSLVPTFIKIIENFDD